MCLSSSALFNHNRVFCCLQPSEMSSSRSWTQSSLRSLSTEEEVRSSQQQGEWCTLLSSWWAHSSPDPHSSHLPLASPVFPFTRTFFNVPLPWLEYGSLLMCSLFNCSVITFLFHDVGFFPHLLWLVCCCFHKSVSQLYMPLPYFFPPGFCPCFNVYCPLCPRPLRGWWSHITL